MRGETGGVDEPGREGVEGAELGREGKENVSKDGYASLRELFRLEGDGGGDVGGVLEGMVSQR